MRCWCQLGILFTQSALLDFDGRSLWIAQRGAQQRLCSEAAPGASAIASLMPLHGIPKRYVRNGSKGEILDASPCLPLYSGLKSEIV
jgi:hypothetical protein